MAEPAYRDEDVLRELYWEEEMSLKEIGEKFGVNNTTINDWMKRNDIERRTPNHKKPVHHRIGDSGYEKWRHSTHGTQYVVFVHRLQMVAEEGFDAVEGMEVHHKNCVTWDNRPSNLELVTTEEHNEITSQQMSVDPADVSDTQLREYVYGQQLSVGQIAEKEGERELSVQRCLQNSPVWERYQPHLDDDVLTYVVENNSVQFAADYFDYTTSTVKQRLRDLDRHDLVPTRPTTEDKYDRERVRELYHEEDYSVGEIADEIGVTSGRVSQIFDKLDIQTGAKSRDPENHPWSDESLMRELYKQQEMTVSAIASRFDCRRETISRWLDNHGIEKRPSSESGRKADQSMNEDTPWRDEGTLREKYKEEGKGMTKVADELDTTRGTIRKWIEKFGIAKHNPTEHDEKPWQDADLLEDMYHGKDMTMKEIADELGCSSAAILQWMDRHDIQRDR